MISAILAMFIGGIGQAFEADGAGTVTGLGWAALFLSILGLVGSILVKNKPKAGGVLMLIAGIGGIISISFFYILAGALLIIPGLISLFSKQKSTSINA
ncbi:hypothetical protein CIG75_15585 [Tumebacillus algifaecis]|uniref:DUF4064 domain-containing protein n=2 Tax=Tumebacillus algifaecis TaxID=1214604 RepID=A0A223D6X5_9BACL|nr:hypothetical protein CIG75_15585 [Tumebacillus algifaecis]